MRSFTCLLVGFVVLFAGNALCASISLPASLYDGAAQLTVVKNTGLTSPEGPACDSAGNLYFSDHRNFSHTSAVIWKAPAGGGAAVVYKQNLDVACGIVFDALDRMVYGGWHGLWRVDNLSAPQTVTVLAQGDSLNEVNDMTLCSDGGMFFTANLWDQPSFVYYRSPAGVLRKAASFPGAPQAAFPNGIEYVEEKQRIYLCLSQQNAVRTYTVDGQKNLVSSSAFATVQGPDGIALDVRGNVYVASSSGNRIAVYDSTGVSLGSINLDWGATNCAFGGDGNRTLYITGGTAVISLRLLTAGRPTTGAGQTRIEQPRRGRLDAPAVPVRRAELHRLATFGIRGQAVEPGAPARGIYVTRAEGATLARKSLVW